MDLTHPWWALLVAIVLVAVTLLPRLLRRRRPPAPGSVSLPVAHLDRVRRLPRYQHLARSAVRATRWSLVGAVLLGIGIVVLVARPTVASTGPGVGHHRDIILCLDVSGSMAQTNRDVIAVYLDLASRLDGERIGLVVFDAAAVTVFPLTDDADVIVEHIAAVESRLETVIPGTRLDGTGTSLIGDGLASCAQRFDDVDAQRSRTIVLATDNQVFGRPLFTVGEAALRAVDASVMVFGVVPGNNSVVATEELRDALRPTGGDVLLLTPDRRAEATIEEAVQSQERAVSHRPPQPRREGLDGPGLVLCLMGGTALVLSHRRLEVVP